MNTEQATAYETMAANLTRRAAEASARPFRFEDLEGGPEPEEWGPIYPKTASASVEKWRRMERKRALTPAESREYGRAVGAWISGLNAVKPTRGLTSRSLCASGQAGDFSAAKHRAHLKARLHAACASDKRAWAMSAAIGEAYEAAMADKRARLSREAAMAVRAIVKEDDRAKAKAERDSLLFARWIIVGHDAAGKPRLMPRKAA